MKYGISQQVWLSIGSNEGNRAKHLQAAVNSLNQHPSINVHTTSSIYETPPWGNTKQSVFYNAIVEIGTALEPLELLNAVKLIESQLGRRAGPRWGPRIIDIDIVLWEDVAVYTEALTIPHTHYRERAFVLVPLHEVAPTLKDPNSGHSIEALLDTIEDKDQVHPVADTLHIPNTPHSNK